MVHHMVVFTFVPDAAADAVDELQSRLEALPASIPEIRGYRVVRDLGLRAGNGDMAVMAEFDDADGFVAYVNHAAHQAVVSECIQGLVATRSALQYAD